MSPFDVVVAVELELVASTVGSVGKQHELALVLHSTVAAERAFAVVVVVQLVD